MGRRKTFQHSERFEKHSDKMHHMHLDWMQVQNQVRYLGDNWGQQTVRKCPFLGCGIGQCVGEGSDLGDTGRSIWGQSLTMLATYFQTRSEKHTYVERERKKANVAKC